jgi:hypothetical protein
LKRAEFDEMLMTISNKNLKQNSDLIWPVCSIAHKVIQYLSNIFLGHSNVSEYEVLGVLSSETMLSSLSQYRGMPTTSNLLSLIEVEKFSTDSYIFWKGILDRVTEAKVALPAREFLKWFDPKKSDMFNMLLKFGYLTVSEENKVKFASEMHAKVWLQSSRGVS